MMIYIYLLQDEEPAVFVWKSVSASFPDLEAKVSLWHNILEKSVLKKSVLEFLLPVAPNIIQK